MKANLLFWVLFSALFIAGTCQSSTALPRETQNNEHVPAAPTAASVGAYTDEPAVIERLDAIYEMAPDGTGWRQVTMAARVQSEAAIRQLGVLNVPYAGSSERVEILYCRVRHLDGTVVETPPVEAIEMPQQVTREAPFYSDLKQKQLPVRSLRVGDTLEWQTRVIRTKAETPGQFWGQESFTDDGVALAESIELRVPKDIYVNVWSPANKPTETIVGAKRIFRWEASQRKPTVGKEADAAREAKKKQVWTAEQELEATQGKLPTIAWTTFKSWEAVGAWYRGLEGDRFMPNPEIKAKVAELTAGRTTDEEKVRAIYAYVSTQIRYIGVAFGVGRYQPHTAPEVLQNQYGDCKDKHTLLAAMLIALGVRTDAVLIGAGVRFNEPVPSPASFNHLITLAHTGGQDVWLDATAEVAPYRMLMYAIRDRSSLVVPESGAARIERTPAKLPFDASQKMNANGTLDKEGTSNSRISLMLRGDDELMVRAVLRQLSPGQYDAAVQQLSQGMGYGGTATHAEISRLENTAEPLTISYDYKREKGGDWDNYKIVPQIAPITLPRPDEKEPPVRAIALGVPRVEVSTSAMKLPDGWGVELPEAVHGRCAYATYDETYRFAAGVLYTDRRVEVLQEKVPVTDWMAYKKWADKVDLGNEQYIQLTRAAGTTSKGPPVAGSAQPGAGNAEAAKLVIAAYKAIGEHDLDAAKPLLDQAKSLNAEQPWLWTTYGYLEYQHGEMSAAIVDYQKELALYPDRYGTYGSLADAENILGKRQEAQETLRQWLKVEEGNPMPAMRLAGMLLEDGNAAAAEAVAASSLAQLPEEKKSDYLRILLGKAQMKAGMKEKGRTTLLAVMEKTESPEMMNDSAYELADAGEELPRAEAVTRTALDKMGEESRTWTLDESPQVILGKSRLIAATWDTMGWILYREGRFDDAESYLKAGWRNGLSRVPGEHLGDLLRAKGDKAAALTAYELALATIPNFDMMGVRKKAAGADETRLKEHIATLKKAGVRSVVPDPAKALQQLHMISAGAAGGLNGTAEYRLLLSGGKVDRVIASGSKVLEGGAARVKAVSLADFWPAGSQANLARGAFLNCHSGACELVFEP